MSDNNIQENWRKVAIKEQADVIRKKLQGTRLYGEPVDPDDADAMLMAAYALGEFEHRERLAGRMTP